jgi:hypothetical protein
MRVSVRKSVTTGGNKSLFPLGAAPQTLRAALLVGRHPRQAPVCEEDVTRFCVAVVSNKVDQVQQHTVTPVWGASGTLIPCLKKPPLSPRPRVLGTHVCPSLHPHRKAPFTAFQVAFSPDTSSLSRPRSQSLSCIHASCVSRPPPRSLYTTRPAALPVRVCPVHLWLQTCTWW